MKSMNKKGYEIWVVVSIVLVIIALIIIGAILFGVFKNVIK